MSPARCRGPCWPRSRTCGCCCRAFRRSGTALPTRVQVAELEAPWGERVRLRLGRIRTEGAPDLQAYWIDAPWLYDRPGNPYEDAQRQPYGDNHRRFALLGFAAAQIAHGLDAAWQPQVVHAHDWHAAPGAGLPGVRAPATGIRASAASSRSTTWLTRGCSRPGISPTSACRPPPGACDGLEYHGQLSFMKGGPGLRRPHHHRESDLRPRDPDARAGLRAGRPVAPPRRRSQRHPQRRSTTRSGTRRTDALLPHRFEPGAIGRQGALQDGAAGAARAGAGGRDAALRGREPPDRAEGPAPGARRARRPAGAGRPAGPARQRRCRAGARIPRTGRGRAAVGQRHAGLQRAARAPPVRRRRRDAGALAASSPAA